jgi:hypothetical protein
MAQYIAIHSRLNRCTLLPGVTNRSAQISVLIGTSVLVGLFALVCYPFSRAAAQQHNLNLAREHAELVAPIFREDYRFFQVRLSETTAGGGTLLVSGHVSSDEDLADLKALVKTTHPPVDITWAVDVRAPSTLPADSL